MASNFRRRAMVIATAVMLAALVLAGCGVGLVVGSGKTVTEEREISGVEGVALSFVGDLQITQGDEEKLVITADDNVLPLITTEVNNGILTIGGRSTVGMQVMSPLRYDLTVRDLNSVRLSGAGNAEMDGLETGDLKVEISGAGNLAIRDLKAERVDATLSGLGNVELGGEAQRQAVRLSGAGSYSGGDLQTGSAKIELSGLGGATVWATESLDVRISGAGNVEYYGDPQVTQEIGGLGNVEGLGEK
jgi:hypothetical protein